jgi:hypothetical protein
MLECANQSKALPALLRLQGLPQKYPGSKTNGKIKTIGRSTAVTIGKV